MKPSIFRLLPCLLLGLLASAGRPAYSQSADFNENSRKLSIALYAIANLYVDSIGNDKLVENAITGMLEKLDPHSSYMDPEETKEMTEPLEGNFDGIGIQFNMLTDTLYVIQVIPGGPSEKVGMLPGDRIMEVNDTLIAGVKMKTSDVMKRLRGPKGTEVRIKVLRGGSPQWLEFKITRGKIPVYSLDAAYMVDPTTGYIKLNRFALTTDEEFRQALARLKKAGMQNLILDLQSNGGGYLKAAVDLADEFLDKDKLIVYTQGDKQKRDEAKSTSRGEFEQGRLVVLIDEASASASEIVSGAVQDWDRAILVGRRSFGKGLVQKPVPLPDGSMIRLTVSRYYTPTGRCIQKPYEKGHKEQYEEEFYKRFDRGELMHADSIHFADSLKYQTLLSGRTVYGGGGIMPDIFVPADTTGYSDYLRDLVAKGVVYRVSMDYIDRHRQELKKKYPTFEKFRDQFRIDNDIEAELRRQADREKIPFNEAQYAISRSLIALQLKALIARDLYDMNEYYQIVNEANRSLKEALRIINDPKEYDRILKREVSGNDRPAADKPRLHGTGAGQ